MQKPLIEIKKLNFYVWTGLVFVVIWLLNFISAYPESYGERTVNNIWRVSYLVFVHYFLFEYTLPLFTKKRIILPVALLFVHIILYSWGLSVWRELGIAL